MDPKPKLEVDVSGVEPPKDPEVVYREKAVLFTADGKPLKRKIGF